MPINPHLHVGLSVRYLQGICFLLTGTNQHETYYHSGIDVSCFGTGRCFQAQQTDQISENCLNLTYGSVHWVVRIIRVEMRGAVE